MKILAFTLNTQSNILDVGFDDQNEHYSFEYLRVFTPSEWQKSQPQAPKVFHKKQIKLTTIESLGKHGYRFIFDDGHQDIFTPEFLLNLAQQYKTYWPLYLEQTNSAGNNREMAIDITQL